MGEGRSADIVVVGGGLVGCLAARALAGEGFRVRLVERGPQLGREASTAAAGMLSPQMEAAEDLLVEVPEARSGRAMLDLCLAARDGWPAFAAELESETGRDVHLRSDGTLVVALTPVEAGRLERSAHEHQQIKLKRDQQEQQHRKRVQQETLSHPLVKDALNILGGEVIDIKES